MISQHRLFGIRDRTHVDLVCEPFDSGDALHDVILHAASAAGLRWTHWGWLSIGEGGGRWMTAIPAESAPTLDALFALDGPRKLEHFSITYCLASRSGVQVYIRADTLPGRGTEGQQNLTLGLEDSFPVGNAQAYPTLESFFEATKARTAVGFNPKSILAEWGRFVLATKPPPPASWREAGSFQWLNLVDDDGIRAWLLRSRASIHCHRLVDLGSCGTCLVLWQNPFPVVPADEVAYARALWNAAIADEEPPPFPLPRRRLLGARR